MLQSELRQLFQCWRNGPALEACLRSCSQEADTTPLSNEAATPSCRKRSVLPSSSSSVPKRQKPTLKELQQLQRSGSRLTKKQLLSQAEQLLLQRACITAVYEGDVVELDSDDPLDKDDCTPPTVPHLRTPLKSWQCSGVNWMMEREGRLWRGFRGGFLCDDMGLGKTLCFLALISMDWAMKSCWPLPQLQLRSSDCFVPTTLIIVDSSVAEVWRQQAEQHFQPGVFSCWQMPDMGLSANQPVTLEQLQHCRIAFITYSMLTAVYRRILQELVEESDASRKPPSQRVGAELLFSVIWRRVVADEGHCLCKKSIYMHNAFRSLRTTRRWTATGTPARNRSTDFPGLMRAMGISSKHRGAVLQRLTLSRSKADMNPEETQLKKCYLIDVALSAFATATEQRLYDLAASGEAWSDAMAAPLLLNQQTLLRQLCIAPELLYLNRGRETVRSQFSVEFVRLLDDYMAANQPSTKMREALDIVKRALKVGGACPEQLVVFFREAVPASRFLHWLQPVCEQYDTSAILLDGQTDVELRHRLLRRFDRGKARVALLTVATGGQGISLVRANSVLLMEPLWNEGQEKQAWDRCYRLGQQKDVLVHRIYIKNTEEERLWQLKRSKAREIGALLGRTDSLQGLHSMSYEEAKRQYEESQLPPAS